MSAPVEISFDCLPLRSVGRLDVPLDASAAHRELCLRIKHAIETHGAHNSYYLRTGECVFHLTNDPTIGVISYRFEGVVLTDPTDRHTQQVDLQVELAAESCEWLTKAASEWFNQTVSKAVAVEFNEYIAAGDLELAHQRMDRIQQQVEAEGGFLGMYL
jgi:hypothetical protein